MVIVSIKYLMIRNWIKVMPLSSLKGSMHILFIIPEDHVQKETFTKNSKTTENRK